MNRPSPAKVNELIPSELKNKDVFNTPILLGGPVEPNSFWAIHSSEISIQDTRYYLLENKFWASEKSTDLIESDLDQKSDLRPKPVPHAQNDVIQHADMDQGSCMCPKHDQPG